MSVYLIDYENVNYAGLTGVEKLTKEDEVVLFYSENASTITMDLHIKIVSSGASLRYIRVNRTGKNYLDFQLSALSGFLVAESKQTEYVVVSKDTGFNAVIDFWNQQDFLDRKVHFVRRAQIAPDSPKKQSTVKRSKAAAEKKQTSAKQAEKQKQTKTQQKTGQSKKAEKAQQETKTAIPSKQNSAPKKKKAAPLSAHRKAEIRNAVKEFQLPPSDYTKIYRLFRNAEGKHEYNIALIKSFQDQEKGNRIYKATVRFLQEKDPAGNENS